MKIFGLIALLLLPASVVMEHAGVRANDAVNATARHWHAEYVADRKLETLSADDADGRR